MENDADLRGTVDRARDFDPDAWEALYRRLHPRLHAYARRRLPGDQACDDAVSEAFARAMAAIDRFRWSAAGFDGWLFGILRNVLLEQHRVDARRAPGGMPEDVADRVPCDEPGPLERLVSGEQALAVRHAFEQLAPADRELLELRVLGGLDAEAVGEVVGKRPGAVRMAQSRALARLDDLLGEAVR